MKTLRVDQRHVGYTDTAPIESIVGYRVEKVTNSTEPRIMDMLTVDQLDVYCASDEWEVVIK